MEKILCVLIASALFLLAEGQWRPVVKPGRCPIAIYHIFAGMCVRKPDYIYCSGDHECPNGMKCCFFGCNFEKICRGPMENTRGCDYGGKIHKEWSVFLSKDGCNVCRCINSQVRCTDKKCDCFYDNKWYQHGQTFRAIDACNICYCGRNNRTSCTKSRCRDVCMKPQVIGPCKSYIPRFWFNRETLKCEIFEYGGCLGNENNFETAAECMEQCEGHQ